jgi:hypothetical protein
LRAQTESSAQAGQAAASFELLTDFLKLALEFGIRGGKFGAGRG